MKTVTKRLVAAIVAALILVTAVVPSFAMTEGQWTEWWQSDDGQAGIIVFPGSDESERNFSWYYSEQSNASLHISENSNMSNRSSFAAACVPTDDGNYSYKATVTNLKYDTTYYYQCESGEFKSDIYSFTTDDDDNTFSALYVTDVHITDDSEDASVLKDTSYNFSQTIEAALSEREDISLILSAGDQASSAFESEYRGYSSSPFIKGLSVATAIGNHDRKGVAYKTFKNMPNEKTNNLVSSYVGSDYWFVKGNVLFLVMDSNNGSGVDHRNFVKAAVNANPDVKWRVMMFHHDLYGGRIPHRESENELLRLLWAPIADEFAVDLVLLGHSHYYTISNAMYNNKSAEPYSAQMTDLKGTIYMVSGSINRPRNDEDLSLGENISYAHLTDDPIYNILDFTHDSITVSSYGIDDDEPFNSYEIVKTTKNGGHSDRLPPLYNFIIRGIGTVYAIFNNIGVYQDLKDSGYDIGFFECVFA